MMDAALLECLPITAVYVVVTVLMLAACEVGFRSGDRARTRQDNNAPTSLGPMVGGLLGLLAFVLAFTFSMAASQYDLRKHNVLEEANAIGTAFLRTDLMHEPVSQEMKNLLREYVGIRLEAAAGGDLSPLLARSGEIHDDLWSHVVAAAKAAPTTNTALMIESINDVIDMHETRLSSAFRNRIPSSIWIALIAISLLTTMTMGVQAGLAGKRRLIAVVPLALAFGALVVLVVDLDRPQEGLIKVGQQAMTDLQRDMARP